jgi:hypothetical protein
MDQSDDEGDMHEDNMSTTTIEGIPDSSQPCAVMQDSGCGNMDNFCWLCKYQGNRTTNEVVRFIMDGIPHMSIDSLVTQSKFLLDNVEVNSNTTLVQLKRHITDHMMHPRIKLALQLQEMCNMQNEIKKCCVTNDAETGERTVNPQAMRVYLTLCSQVSALYKVGEDKLIFNNSSMDK